MSAAAVLGWRQLGGVCCLTSSGVGVVSLYLSHESRALLSCPHNRNVFFEAGHFSPLKPPLPAWSLHCPILTLAGPKGSSNTESSSLPLSGLGFSVWAFPGVLPHLPTLCRGREDPQTDDCCTLTYTDPECAFARCAPPTGSRIPSCAQASVVPNSLPLSCGTQTLLLPPGSSPGFWA